MPGLVREHLLEAVHPVAVELEGHGHHVVAAAPLPRADTQCGTDLRGIQLRDTQRCSEILRGAQGCSEVRGLLSRACIKLSDT